ncbi:hypothetical protein GGR44_001126 [Sphingobium fontiphilum]|uniref:DUF3168 domain-containing protein n=1 Tax=Sphingobium fontiphilum TaxID=944425 RepID=A0A7W6DM23_9SPHN|nr:DUF3168 domain-containing protein [Sphingobium fontiphilum]MBB3981479.1 hypothetical protein [Sphingobium fontiphilum]
MSAEMAVRGAVLAALRADGDLAGRVNGVSDGDVGQASGPYVMLAECSGADWGGKGLDGREVRIAIELRDPGEGAGGIAAMLTRVDGALHGLAGLARDGWHMVGVALIRSRIARPGPGHRREGGWRGVVDYRVRALRAEG